MLFIIISILLETSRIHINRYTIYNDTDNDDQPKFLLEFHGKVEGERWRVWSSSVDYE